MRPRARLGRAGGCRRLGWTLALGLAAAGEAGAGQEPLEKGMALGLFSQEASFAYDGLLEEVKATGSTHVALTWVWWQDDLRANEIREVPGWSATRAQVEASIRKARALGLHVTLFPIVRLIRAEKSEWRGRIAPTSEDDWWRSYEAFVLETARIARDAGADRLSVGSELLSRERARSRWLRVIDLVRLTAPKLELMYSANWDHYEFVSFWDAVDVVGLTAYWELTRDLEAGEAELRAGWKGWKEPLERWVGAIGRRVVLTEIGYPSLDGGAVWPWDETRKAPVDQEEQRRAYQAFVDVWRGSSILQGVYFWNWFGFGGPEDAGYTPRKKPAARVIEAWYRGGAQ